MTLIDGIIIGGSMGTVVGLGISLYIYNRRTIPDKTKPHTEKRKAIVKSLLKSPRFQHTADDETVLNMGIENMTFDQRKRASRVSMEKGINIMNDLVEESPGNASHIATLTMMQESYADMMNGIPPRHKTIR